MPEDLMFSYDQFMYVNLILTFSKPNDQGETQEFYELYLHIANNESDAIRFIDNRLFEEVIEICDKTNRDVKDLCKISTASDWSFFTEKTNMPSLPDLGHVCKWWFGTARSDLDPWERSLMNRHSFGLNVD